MLPATNDCEDQGAICTEDADSAAEGNQVNLSVGANTIALTVTSADGQATRTYTVTVTREAG